MSTKVPAIPAPTSANLLQVAQAFKSLIDVREGAVGDPLDANVTYRDLVNAGAVALRPGWTPRLSAQPVMPSWVEPDGYDATQDFTVPPQPANFTASGLFAMVQLQWDRPAYRNHSYAEIWRSETNAIGNAVLVATTDVSIFADNIGASATRYYWVRFVSQADVKGPFSAVDGVSASTAPDSSLVLDSLSGQIRETHLYTDLASRINLIDDPSSVVGSVNARLLSESVARTQGILAESIARSNAIAAETLARSDAIAAETLARNQAISAETSARSDAINAEAQTRANAITAESAARADAIAVEAQARNQAINAEVAARTSAIGAEAQARADALVNEANQRQAQITQEQTARQAADESLASSVTTLSASLTSQVGTLTAAVQSEASARATGDSAEASARSTLATQLRGSYTGTDVAQVSTGLIHSERQSRITSDQNLQSQITTLAATSSSNASNLTALIQEEQTARISGDQALTSSISTLSSTVSGNYSTLNAAILEESSTRATATSAEASARQSLATQLTGGYTGTDVSQVTSGLIFSERQSRVTADSALQTQINTLVAASSGDFQDLFAAIAEEQTARVAGDSANASNTSLLTSRLDNLRDASGTITNKSLEATIVDNKSAQVSGDQALSTQISSLSSTVNTNYTTLNSAIASEASTRASAISAEATSRESLSTQLRGGYSGTDASQVTSGLIYSERVSRVAADQSLQSQIDVISASSSEDFQDLLAAITVEQTARIAGDGANASSISSLTSRLDNVRDANGAATNKSLEATIIENKSAQVVGDQALSSQIGLLSSTVSNNYNTLNSAISNEAATRSTAISAEASLRQSLQTQMRGSYAGTDVSQVTSGLIHSERTSRITADQSLQTQINLLTAASSSDFQDLIASVQEEQTARIQGDQAEATQREVLASQVRGTYTGNDLSMVTSGLIFQERQARSTAVSALATEVSLLSATVGTKTKVYYQSTAPTSSPASPLVVGDLWIDTDVTYYDDYSSGDYVIRSNRQYRWNGTQWLEAIDYGFADWFTAINTEKTARVDGDSALSSQITTLTSLANANSAAISQEATTRASADSTQTALINTLSSQVNSASTGLPATRALLINDYYTKTATDSAISSATTTLTSAFLASDAANLLSAQGYVQNYSYSKSQTDSAISASGTTLTSAYQAADAATLSSSQSYVQNYAYSKSQADSAIATQVSTLAATVNLNNTSQTAALQQEATTRASVDGGLLAKYTVKTDLAGRVAGFGLASETNTAGVNTSSFDIIADRFSISAPNDYTQEATPTSGVTEGKVWYKPSTNQTLRYNGTSWIAFRPIAPFVVQTTPTTANGVTVPAGIYMDGLFIKEGSITNAKIANAAIDNAKIANLDAAKINTGFLNADRIQAGTLDAKIANIDAAVITSGTINTARIGDGTITNAKIGNVIQSADFQSGLTGWKIDKSGAAEFNNATFRGTIDASGVELGKDVGPGSGHYGISLSNADFNNIFLKRSDGVVFFRVNEGGSNSLTFDSATGVLSIKGVLSASQIAIGSASAATTFYDPAQPSIPINSSVNGFLAYTGDTGVGTYVPQTCYDVKSGSPYDCSYYTFAGAPVTSAELEFMTGSTSVPITRRVRTGGVRFVVNAAGTVDHYFSIWYRYKLPNGTYGAWTCLATAIEPQSSYGATSVSAAFTASLSSGSGIQFGFSATAANGNYWNSNIREIRFGTITVTGTNF